MVPISAATTAAAVITEYGVPHFSKTSSFKKIKYTKYDIWTLSKIIHSPWPRGFTYLLYFRFNSSFFMYYFDSDITGLFVYFIHRLLVVNSGFLAFIYFFYFFKKYFVLFFLIFFLDLFCIFSFHFFFYFFYCLHGWQHSGERGLRDSSGTFVFNQSERHHHSHHSHHHHQDGEGVQVGLGTGGFTMTGMRERSSTAASTSSDDSMGGGGRSAYRFSCFLCFSSCVWHFSLSLSFSFRTLFLHLSIY